MSVSERATSVMRRACLIAIDHERLRARHERRASSLLESGQLQVHDAR